MLNRIENSIPLPKHYLNYNKYFVQGEHHISEVDDYTSHNTERLDIQGIKEMLLKLDEKEVGKVHLVSLEDIDAKGFFGKAWSNIKLLVFRFLMEEN